MLTYLFKEATKYLLLFALSYGVYLTYELLVKPFLLWYKYKKYPNVFTNCTFRPFFGDLWYNVQELKNGNVHYYHRIKKAKNLSGYDLTLELEGTNPCIRMVSSKALTEFVSMQPYKIDRCPTSFGLNKFFPHGFSNYRTTKSIQERKKMFTSLLNLNAASKYIPGMLKSCEEILKAMQDGET